MKSLFKSGLEALFCLTFLIFVTAPSLSSAQENHLAKLYSSEGRVEVKNGDDWSEIQRERVLFAGDSIRTLENSRAAFQLPSEIYVRAGANAGVEFNKPSDPTSLSSSVTVLYGSVYFFSRTEK